MWGDPTFAMLVWFQPLVYSLLFGFLFKSTDAEGRMQTLFLGVAEMSIWQTLLYSGGFIVRHEFLREKTVPYNLISATNMMSIWVQRLIGCVAYAIPAFFISLAVGALVFGVHPSLGHLGFLVLGMILFLFSLFSTTLPLILLLFVNPQGGKLIQTLAYPIFLLSGMIVSIDTFPTWVSTISRLFPVSWSTHWLQQVLSADVVNWTEFGLTLVVSLIYLVLSVFLFRFIIKQIRTTGEISL